MIKRAMIFAVAGALAACAGVQAPRDLAAMSADDICYYEYIQGGNLSPAAKQAIQSEMQRRKDSCANHSTQVAKQFADFMWMETYGKQHP